MIALSHPTSAAPSMFPPGNVLLSTAWMHIANDKTSPATGGTMSAGEMSIKQALEAVEENGSKMEGKICLTRQILVPPAVQNHQDFGPNAACTSILLPFSSTASSRSVRTFHQQTLSHRVPDSSCHSRPHPQRS